MNKSIYEEYALLDAQEKEIKARKESKRLEILSKMSEEGVEKVDTNLGKFTVTMLKKWTYPDPVVQLGEEFKAAKAKAESTGDATYVEEPSLRFTQVKL